MVARPLKINYLFLLLLKKKKKKKKKKRERKKESKFIYLFRMYACFCEGCVNTD